jgi:hypothetical protein
VASPFSKYEDFAGMVRHNGIDMKPTLLRVLTDFYVQKPTHTTQEERHFAELAVRLIDEVDGETRAAIAERLRAYGSAPAEVMIHLMQPTAAEPDLDTRPQPIYPETQENIAQAETSEASAHMGIPDSDRMAAAHFSDMFFSAGSADRQAILRQLETGAALLPTLTQADATATIGRLEAAALKGRPFEFVREIENALGIPRVYSEKIVTDSSGEPMLVVAKALAMPTEVLQRILLLVNPAIGTSVRRVFDLSALYQDLAQQAALRLITLWRHAGVPRPPVHQPVQGSAAEGAHAPKRQPMAGTKRDQRAS